VQTKPRQEKIHHRTSNPTVGAKFWSIIHPFQYKGMSVVWSKTLQVGIFPVENLISNNNLFEILYGFLSVCKREQRKMAKLLQLVLEE
jgi:hypothetical protein